MRHPRKSLIRRRGRRRYSPRPEVFTLTLRAAPKDRSMEPAGEKKPLSERKRAAILANLAKANAVRRSPESYARSRHNALKHGLYVRSLEPSFELLGEDPKEFQRLARLLGRLFGPHSERERMLVRRVAEAVWRRFRAFPAQARREQHALRRLSASLPALAHADADETVYRAVKLSEIMEDYDWLLRRAIMLNGEVERLIRLLIACRTDGDASYRLYTVRHRAELAELSTDPKDWVRRYAAGVPLR